MKPMDYKTLKGFCNPNTVYKFHCKLIKYNIIEDTYIKCTNKYLNELNKHTSILHTDTTFVCNKLGIENVSFNQQIKKHETTFFFFLKKESY